MYYFEYHNWLPDFINTSEFL